MIRWRWCPSIERKVLWTGACIYKISSVVFMLEPVFVHFERENLELSTFDSLHFSEISTLTYFSNVTALGVTALSSSWQQTLYTGWLVDYPMYIADLARSFNFWTLFDGSLYHHLNRSTWGFFMACFVSYFFSNSVEKFRGFTKVIPFLMNVAEAAAVPVTV